MFGHPVLPPLLEALGDDARLAAAGRGQRRLREWLRPDEPLGLEPGLDDVVRALAAPDGHCGGLAPDQVAAGLEIGDDPAACLVAVEPRVAVALLIHGGRV